MSIAFDADFYEAGFSGAPAFLGTSFLEGPTDSDGIDNPNSLFPTGNGLVDETYAEIAEAGLKDPRTGLFYEFPDDVLNEKAERMSLFTLNTNGGERPDPVDDAEAYRILSGDPREVRVPPYDPYADLIVADVIHDVRQNIVSGPFEMPNTGRTEFKKVVAAFYFARPASAEVDLNNLTVTGEFKPVIEVWQATGTVYNSAFTVPSPPPAPRMRLIPGDRSVTITWDDTPVDAVDPYSLTEAAAGREPSPDFPQFGYRSRDFEGFRVYRSTSGSSEDAKLIASYDLDNGLRSYSITRAVSTSQGTGDVVETIPLGDDTGLAFSFTDRGEDIGGLINGVPLFYTVTSYDFNPVLVGNESLESGINFRRQDSNGDFYQLAIPRSPSTSIVTGSGNWTQVDGLGEAVTEGLSANWESIGDVGELTSRGEIIRFTTPLAPVINAFAADLSQAVVIDPDNVSSQGGYVVVDSIEHTDKDTRNHVHYVHFEDYDGVPTTSGKFTIPYHEIEGLYPADAVVDQEEGFNFSGPLLADGPAYNGTAYFRKGGLNYGKIAPLRVKPSGEAEIQWINFDGGSYEEVGRVVYPGFEVRQPFVTQQMNGLVSRTTCVAGQFAQGSMAIRWLEDGSVDVWDQANNVAVRFNRMVADGWGFLPLDTWEYDEIVEDQIITEKQLRHTQLVDQAVFVDDPEFAGAERMTLYVRGVELDIRNISERPAAGDEWILDMGFKGSLTQVVTYTSPFAGMRVKLSLTAASKSTAPDRLEKIRVVPNPYIANSLFDSGPSRRAVMFTHLPLRATIRIYTISGNLVNLLNHGPGLEGSIGGSGDRNSGQFSYDLTTRFGDQLASGIYYFHVKDNETGEESLGKFSIIQ